MKRKAMKQQTRRLMLTHLIVACWVVLCLSCRPTLPPAGPVEVEVAPVTQKDVPLYREWVGSTDGSSNATIRAQVTGYITRKYIEGRRVKTGDLLFEIDPRPFEAVLSQAKATLAQAEAQQGKTALDVKRYTPLVKEAAISQEELDHAVQANLGAKAQYEAAKAAVQQAQLNLEFARIVAPIPGIVGISNVDVGDLVSPGSSDLTTVSTVDPIKVNFFPSEQEYLAAVKQPGVAARRIGERSLTLDLVLSDGSTFPHQGYVSAVDRQVDEKTGTIHMQGLFPNPENTLRPGLFVRVRALLRSQKNALVIPQRAVIELQGKYQVAVVGSDNKVSIRTVKVGERIGSDWLIEEGLTPAEHVVVAGVQKVQEGLTVVPKPSASLEGEPPVGGTQPGLATGSQTR